MRTLLRAKSRLRRLRSVRACGRSGVAIPRIEEKCTEKHPKWERLRFLAVVVTWFLSTGGLPRQCAHWLAMTAHIWCALSNTNLSLCLHLVWDDFLSKGKAPLRFKRCFCATRVCKPGSVLTAIYLAPGLLLGSSRLLGTAGQACCPSTALLRDRVYIVELMLP